MNRLWKFTVGGIVCFGLVLLTGCAAIYNDIKAPMPELSVNTSASSMVKVGRSECISYVWVVALGDCSVAAAMKAGGINHVHHVDSEVFAVVLGVYRKITTVVYGD